MPREAFVLKIQKNYITRNIPEKFRETGPWNAKCSLLVSVRGSKMSACLSSLIWTCERRSPLSFCHVTVWDTHLLRFLIGHWNRQFIRLWVVQLFYRWGAVTDSRFQALGSQWRDEGTSRVDKKNKRGIGRAGRSLCSTVSRAHRNFLRPDQLSAWNRMRSLRDE